MTLRLDRLTPRTYITDDKPASTTFQRFWDNICDNLETAFNGNASLTDSFNKLGAASLTGNNEFSGLCVFLEPIDGRQGFMVKGIQVVGARNTGWTAGTGTPNKGAFAAYGGAAMSVGYVQAEAQATNDAARDASKRLLAVEQALLAHGLIGA
jgi:hypothetical protein